MNSSSDKSVRLPMFDGAHKNFQLWWTRFVAYATVYKFVEAINKDAPDPSMPASDAELLDETVDADKTKIAAKKRNAVAMANLSMAFTSEGTMGLVYKAMTSAWPNGLAHLVIKALFKKYQPQDTVTRVELRQMLNKIGMKKNADPATLFEQIASIENRYNTATSQVQQEDLIAVILDAAPMEYKSVLTAEQRVQGTNLTMSDLETVMNQHWRQISHAEQEPGNGGTEITLSAFAGVCFKCGGKGHKATNCPENEKDKKNKGKKCFRCGKMGHISPNCWEDDKNAHLRPANWKSARKGGSEKAVAAVESGNKIEYLLCGMSFPSHADILNDPNVWIADTAATVHSTPSNVGFTKPREATKTDSVTMGNGVDVGAVKLAQLPGVICDKEGRELQEATLDEVTHLPGAKFNLFSLSRMTRIGGWTLNGNKEAI